jgi:hypothetical protein
MYTAVALQYQIITVRYSMLQSARAALHMSKEFSSALLKLGEIWAPAPAPAAALTSSGVTTDLTEMERVTDTWESHDVTLWAKNSAKLSDTDAHVFGQHVFNGRLLCSYAFELSELSKTGVSDKTIILGPLVSRLSTSSVRLILYALARFKVTVPTATLLLTDEV